MTTKPVYELHDCDTGYVREATQAEGDASRSQETPDGMITVDGKLCFVRFNRVEDPPFKLHDLGRRGVGMSRADAAAIGARLLHTDGYKPHSDFAFKVSKATRIYSDKLDTVYKDGKLTADAFKFAADISSEPHPAVIREDEKKGST